MPSVQIINPQVALEQTCRTLRVAGLNSSTDSTKQQIDGDLLMQLAAAMARRLCGFMCPCAPRDVAAAIERSLSRLPGAQLQCEAIAQAAVDDLLAIGDVLELDRVTLAGAEHEPNWLFCAPPSFISRGQRIYITGIGPDDASFLPISIREQVVCEGGTRFIERIGEDGALEATLASHGLRRLDPQRWLTAQRATTPEAVVNDIQQRLRNEGGTGHLEGLTVLTRRSAGGRSYSARWRALKDESGVYVARLPKAYGAPLWLLIDTEMGSVRRSLLLPLAGSRSRACDEAWRLQLAIDAHEEQPATYRVQPDESGATLRVDFPLPMEARRRLILIGGRRRADSPHLSFWIPHSQLEAEERYLQQQLWFQRSDNL